MLSPSLNVSLLILTTILQRRYCYYLQFLQEEAGSERLGNLGRVTQLESDRARTYTQIYPTKKTGPETLFVSSCKVKQQP